MAREHGPYSVAFPVDFTSKGDTTRDAFSQHIKEIARIYTILTGLDADMMDADTLSNLLKNYKPSLSFSDITGNLDASKVVGDLTKATIDFSRVKGIEDYLAGLCYGLIVSSRPMETGWIGFNNNILIQWGRSETLTGWPGSDADNSKITQPISVSFGTSFGGFCYGVIPALCFDESGSSNSRWVNLQLDSMSKDGFQFRLYSENMNTDEFTSKYHVNYIAVGNI